MIRRVVMGVLAVTTALVLGGLLGPLGDVSSQALLSAPPDGVSGRLVLPRNRDLIQVTASSGAEERLLAGTTLTSVTQASWAPNAAQVAYSVFRFWRPDRPAGSDLYVVGSGGGEPTAVLPAEGEDTSFTEPVWTADGRSIVYSAIVRIPESRLGETTNQVERIPAAGGARQLLVPDAFSPAVSKDGRQLAFLRASLPSAGGEVSLWVADENGQNPRTVLADRRFDSLAFARVAPSGDRIAFVAVGGPAPVRRSPGRLLQAFAPRLAAAHGLPWDLWEVRVDGSGLRRLTELAEDDPAIAWSPDGRWIAFQGGSGLWLIDAATTAAYHMNETISFGGIDWTS
jgi:Tol biopolymer transport system component